MTKVFINTCITGLVPTKKDTPFVPITEREIIKDALKVAEAGAAIVHIHARDKNGYPTWQKSYYERIIGGIKEKNDKLLICVSTSGRLWGDLEKRSDCLNISGDLKPDLASLTVGSMNFIHTESVNSPSIIKRLALIMREKSIKPELEIFEPGMINAANYFINKGIIVNRKPYFNLFFGSLGTSPFHPSVIAAYLALLPENSVWAGAGIGEFQMDANVLALCMGGHIRVGIEDNTFFDRRRTIPASNSRFVNRIIKMAKMMNLEIATIEETRKLLF